MCIYIHICIVLVYRRLHILLKSVLNLQLEVGRLLLIIACSLQVPKLNAYSHL